MITKNINARTNPPSTGLGFTQLLKPAVLSACVTGMLAGFSAPAFTTADADNAINSYNNAFYVVSGGLGHYKRDTAGGPMGWWTGAEEIEMLIDAYERSNNTIYRNMITELINGFYNRNGTSWSYNIFNDDIQWMCIASARGYQKTGNTNFRDRAKQNFDMMYARGWDSVLGGGIYWTTDKQEKNACSNGPAAIAAYLLYQIYGDSSYLTKANNIYNWERSRLFNTSNGAVYDNVNLAGSVNTWTFSYNSGTFIGAGNFLGRTADAQLAANYVKNTMCTGGIFPVLGTGDGAGFNGIGIRWIAKYMKDRGLQSTYQPWLQQNANAAWNFRRSPDNLSWQNWTAVTPAGTLGSWDCSGSVVVMQVVPADGSSVGVRFYQDANYGAGVSQIIAKGNYTMSQLAAKGVPNDWASSIRIPQGHKVIMYQHENFTGTSWTFTSDTSYVGSAANDQMTSCRIQ